MSSDRSAAEAFEAFLALRARGERVDFAALVARFPEHASEFIAAHESLELLERTERTRRLDDELPERVGPYRIVRAIGRGGMGVVFEALEEPLGRRIALKVLPPELLASAVARERFRREAHIASRLEHSGISTIYGAGVDADSPWIAMRYIEGETLAQRIASARERGARCVDLDGAARDGGREAVLRAASCMASVARALHHAHVKGIVHRDVKPSNVMITPRGEPVLLDFGLAIGAEPDAPTLTRTGQTAGTPAYLPPELVGGESARHDVRSDVYALGVTLYECLSLRRPFEGPTQIALYRAITSGTAPAVNTLNRAVPRDLAVVVATAMEREPARRYRDAEAFALDLEACAAGRPILARPLPLHGRVSRWARREPRQALLASLLAATFVALTFLGATWWSSRDRVLAADGIELARRFETELQDGYASLATRRSVDADASFVRALAIEPASVEALVGRALVRIDGERDAEAIEILARAPDTPAITALRAVANDEWPPLELDATWLASSSSIELFVDGLRLSEQAKRAPRREQASIEALASARFEEAVVRSRGARAFFHVKRAFSARAANDEAGVRSAAAALATLWPDSARALFTAGNTLRTYDRDLAIEFLRRSIALDPTWGPPHQNLGNALYTKDDFEGAIIELEAAIRLDPRDADAYNTLGLAYDGLGCVDEAQSAFHTAACIRPRLFEAWANFGIRANLSHDERYAEPALRMALALDPHEVVLHEHLAELLHERGDLEEEFVERQVVLGMNPHDLSACSSMAAAYLNRGEPDWALDALDLGLEAQPGQPDLLNLRAIAVERIEAQKRGH